MADRAVLYPSVFNVPRGAQDVVTPSSASAVAIYPHTTRGKTRQQPRSDNLPDGRFTTTNTTYGGNTLSPSTTCILKPQQPQGDVLVPGNFLTTNTQYGGENWYQSTTSRLKIVQPDGHTLPISYFTTTNTTFGGSDTLAPSTTCELKPTQPAGYLLPPGLFSTTTNIQYSSECYSPSTTTRRGSQHLVNLKPVTDVYAITATQVSIHYWECVTSVQVWVRQRQQLGVSNGSDLIYSTTIPPITISTGKVIRATIYNPGSSYTFTHVLRPAVATVYVSGAVDADIQ